MNWQRPSFPTNYGASFLLDKDPDSFIPYSYSPSITNDRLSSFQVNNLLKKLELLHIKQSRNIKFYCGVGFMVNFAWMSEILRYEASSQYTKGAILLPFGISLGIIGCLALWEYRRTEKEKRAVIDEENQVLREKGVRWYLPENSQTIELHTDYKFLRYRSEINDEDVGVDLGLQKLRESSKKPTRYGHESAVREEAGA